MRMKNSNFTYGNKVRKTGSIGSWGLYVPGPGTYTEDKNTVNSHNEYMVTSIEYDLRNHEMRLYSFALFQ